jgi:hypothetical protein
MADNSKKVSQLLQSTVANTTDRIVLLKDPAGSPSLRTIPVSNFVQSISGDLNIVVATATNTNAGIIIVGNNLSINAATQQLSVNEITQISRNGFSLSLGLNGRLNLPVWSNNNSAYIDKTGNNGTLVINSFGLNDDGSFLLPGNSLKISNTGTIFAAPNGYTEISASVRSQYMRADDTGAYIRTNANSANIAARNQWAFNVDGTTLFPRDGLNTNNNILVITSNNFTAQYYNPNAINDNILRSRIDLDANGCTITTVTKRIVSNNNITNTYINGVFNANGLATSNLFLTGNLYISNTLLYSNGLSTNNLTLTGSLVINVSSGPYANDQAANSAGILIGGVYYTSDGTLKIRLT